MLSSLCITRKYTVSNVVKCDPGELIFAALFKKKKQRNQCMSEEKTDPLFARSTAYTSTNDGTHYQLLNRTQASVGKSTQASKTVHIYQKKPFTRSGSEACIGILV